MLSLFLGEFLFHPCPIDISGNTCSHGCLYCFANIRKTNRVCKLKSTLNYLNKDSNKTYLNSLLQEGFPINLSNKSDPFSKNNYLQTLSILQHIMARDNGLFIQTKGGLGVDEALSIIGDKRNVVWYITITSLNKEIVKQVEPGAPNTDERLKLIEILHGLGFMVIVALNPLVQQWMPGKDLNELLGILKRIGIKHIIHEALHINKKEIKTFSNEKRKIIGTEVLNDAEKFQNVKEYSRSITKKLQDEGFTIFKLGFPHRTELFNDVRKRLGLIFPNQWDALNYCYNKFDQIKQPFYFNYSDYQKEITKYKPEFFQKEYKGLQGYLIRYSFRQWAGNNEAQSINTLNGILNFHWNKKQCRTSLQNNYAFRKFQDNGKDVLDQDGNIILYFDGEIHFENRIFTVN